MTTPAPPRVGCLELVRTNRNFHLLWGGQITAGVTLPVFGLRLPPTPATNPGSA